MGLDRAGRLYVDFRVPPNVLTPVPGFRWWGDNLEWRAASWGPSSDSGCFLTVGARSFSLPDGPQGSLEHAYSIHLRATGLGTICVDSGFYSPAADHWVFYYPSQGGIDPSFNGPFCFPVVQPPPGDINCDGQADVGDAVYMINWIFRDGPGPFPPEAGDINCDDTPNIGDAVYLINWIFKKGNSPCDPDGDGEPNC